MIEEHIQKANLKRIGSWILKSNLTIDKFDRFIAMFIACNIFYSLYAKTKNDNANLYHDRRNCLAIKELLSITPANMKLIKKFYSRLSVGFSLENRDDDDNDLINKLKNRIEAFESDENNENNKEELLGIVVECLYTIRCNLLHGVKDIIKKQKKLMSFSTPLLKSLLNSALEEYKKEYLIRNN